jgi:fido (protein-threonine AMPylation protein)
LSEERHLRGLNQERFASRLAEILETLNAVLAFREGNGRTPREFVRELACKNSYWIDWKKVSREELHEASDASFMRGDNTLFEKCSGEQSSRLTAQVPATGCKEDLERA